MGQRARPAIIIDECLPVPPFKAVFEGCGFTVLTVGDAFPSGSPDRAVLAAAEATGAIIVSSDTDWNALLRVVPSGQKGQAKRAGRILFNCDHDVAIQRLRQRLDAIVREIDEAVAEDRQLPMRITGQSIRVDK